MPINLHSEILWGWEARCALDMLVNGDDPVKLLESLLQKLPGHAQPLRALLSVSVEAYSSMRDAVNALGTMSEPLRFLLTKLADQDVAPIDALLGLSLPILQDSLTRDQLAMAYPKLLSESFSNIFNNEEEFFPIPDINDMRAVFQWLQARGATDATQSALLRVYTQTDSLLDALLPTLQVAVDALKMHADSFKREVTHLTRHTGQQLFSLLHDLGITMDASANYDVYPLVISPNSATLAKEDGKAGFIMRLSVALPELLPLINSAQLDVTALQSALHVMTDKTKLEILTRLAERPWYGAELAEALGLSGATVSHHVGHLLGRSLLTAENVGNRLYYSLNSERIRELLDALRSLLKL